MLFSKANFAVAAVASKDTAERKINCVRLHDDGSTVATNGRVLMAVGPVKEGVNFPDVGTQSSPGPGGVSMPLEAISRVVKRIPKGRLNTQYAAMTKASDPRKVELTTTDLVHVDKTAVQPISEAYPNWKATIRGVRGDKEKRVRVCVDRGSLLELLKAFTDACPESGESPLWIEVNPDSGVMLRAFNRDTGQRVVGVSRVYTIEGDWLKSDPWEKTVFNSEAKVPIK